MHSPSLIYPAATRERLIVIVLIEQTTTARRRVFRPLAYGPFRTTKQAAKWAKRNVNPSASWRWFCPTCPNY